MKSTTVYKLTTADRKSIISAWDWSNHKDKPNLPVHHLAIHYPLFKWTYPRIVGAYLLAFNDKELALEFGQVEMLSAINNFATYLNGLILWECRTDSISDQNPDLVLPSIYFSGIEDYKNGLMAGPKYFRGFPKGTIGCNRIRLIKKLHHLK